MGNVVGIVVFVFLLASCGVQSLEEPLADLPAAAEEAAGDAADETIEEEYSVAEKLAIIDGKSVEEGPAYQVFLDGALEVCPDETQESLGDLAVRAKQILEERGVEADNLWLLGNLMIAIPEGNEALGLDCGEVGATLLVMELGE